MKDNIPSSHIYNRKIILELRYIPIPTLLDFRGKIADAIIKSKIISNAAWSIDQDSIKIVNNFNEILGSIHINIVYNRLHLIYFNPGSIEEFWNLFRKLFSIFQNNVTSCDIYRIGCRITGTYSTQSNDYKDIINNFQQIFPSSTLLDDFPVQDMQFILEYSNGMYSIGPIKEKDAFIINNFPNIETRCDKTGFGIDTDNFIIREANEPISVDHSSVNTALTQIQNVLTTSLSVEKLLFDKLNIL